MGPLSPADSDATVEMPERFDEEGKRKSERGDDAIVDVLEDIFSGKGPGGKYFKKIFGGGGSGDGDGGEGGSGGGRRRRSRR